jgi:hypothetical protein
MTGKNLAPITSAQAPVYRYFTVDLLSNKVLGEIPFEDVTYERSLKQAGAFSAKITMTKQTEDLSLYNSTLPGRTALFVVRDGVCMWGGIIWGRNYDLITRSMTISASEFTSYLQRRVIWKPYSYAFTADLVKSRLNMAYVSITDKTLKTPLIVRDARGVRNSVLVMFRDRSVTKFNSFYFIAGVEDGAPSDPTPNGFYIDIPNLPNPKGGSYTGVSVTSRTDTYDYVREIVTDVFNDFADIDFANEIIAPGISRAITVNSFSILASDNYNGVATITTTTPHKLAVGQIVELANIHETLTGSFTVSEIPTKTMFKIPVSHPLHPGDKLTALAVETIPTTEVSTIKDRVHFRQIITTDSKNITHLQRFNGLVTLTLSTKHLYQKDDILVLSIANAAPANWTINQKQVNTFDYSDINNVIHLTAVGPYTITFQAPTYTSSTYNLAKKPVADISKNTVTLADPKTQLKLFTPGSHGYTAGDRVRISGVDSIGWKTPIYDGYNVLTATDPGTTANITAFSGDADTDLITLFFASDPGIDGGEFVTVVSGNGYIKGTHRCLKGSDEEAQDPQEWTITFAKNLSVDIAKTNVSNSTASVKGQGWILANPTYDQLSTVSLSEPDAVNSISTLEFKTGSTTDRAGKALVGTAVRHNYAIGDVVKINFTDPATNKIYGSSAKTVSGTGDLDQIVYNIQNQNVPFNDVARSSKKGTITRLKAKVGSIPIVEVNTRALMTDGNLVTVLSMDHDLNVGDFIKITFAGDDGYNIYESNGESVQIVSATANSFSYYAPGQSTTSSQVIIKSVEFLTNKVSKRDAIRYKAVTDNFLVRDTPIVEQPVDPPAPAPEDRVYQLGAIDTDIGVTIGGKKYNLVNYTTTGAGHGITQADVDSGLATITVAGLPAKGTTQGYTRPATTLNPYRVDFIWKSGKNGTARLYFDIDPGTVKGEKITIGGFDTDSGTQVGKTVTINTWAIQSVSVKSRLSSRSVTTLTAATPMHNAQGIINNYYIDIAVNGMFSKSWSVPIITSGGYITTPAKVITPAKATIGYNQFNVTNGKVIRYVNSETVSVATSLTTKLSAVDTSQMTATMKVHDPQIVAPVGTGSTQTNPANPSSPPDLRVGDAVDIYGFTDIKNNKYSQLNGKAQTILSVSPVATDAAGRGYVLFTVAAPATLPKAKVNGVLSRVKYANRVGTSAAAAVSGITEETIKGNSYHQVPGHAILDYQAVSTSTRDISNMARPSKTTAVVTSQAHGFEVGDWVNIWVYDKNYITFTCNSNPVQITAVDANTFTYTLPGTNNFEVTHADIQRTNTGTYVVLTIAPDAIHHMFAGDVISLTSMPSSHSSLQGQHTLISASPRTITFKATTSLPDSGNKSTLLSSTGTVTASTAIVIDEALDGVVIPAGMVVREPVAFTRTYGEYPGSSNMGGIEFSTSDYSDLSTNNAPIRGSDLTNVASHLEQYSNIITGFDYRIDCQVVTDPITGNKSFKKIFKLIPLYPPALLDYINTLPLQQDPYDPNRIKPIHALQPGQSAPASVFGANLAVFEYPGNIRNITFVEDAQNAATRVFVSSNNPDTGAGEAAYSGAAAEDLLSDGWPILDRAEKADWPIVGLEKANIDNWGNYDSERDLFKTAKRYLYESKPPEGDFVITVNGSLNPVVGKYNPGDWCSIIVNDNFIKSRLAHSLEPRSDVIIRKIDTIRVTVPNNPAYPEQVDLTIVTDWQVDKVGE